MPDKSDKSDAKIPALREIVSIVLIAGAIDRLGSGSLARETEGMGAPCDALAREKSTGESSTLYFAAEISIAGGADDGSQRYAGALTKEGMSGLN